MGVKQCTWPSAKIAISVLRLDVHNDIDRYGRRWTTL
jgi:hypothetical protein